ncbi:MAG: SDR family NAD(P)-dependent oxidoreductase [Cyanobium sp.]
MSPEAALRTPAQLFDLSGRRAVVTGASSGIGQRMALVLAMAGARVLLVARRGDRLEALRHQHPALAECLLPAVIDLSEAGAPEAIAAAAAELLGGCDILVGAAGIPGRASSAQVDAPAFARVLQLNVIAQATVAAALFPALCRSEAGRVIHVGSIYGLVGEETGPLAPYVASKHALVGLMRSQAGEWIGRGITVNLLAPGHIPTEMTATLLQDPVRAPQLLRRYPIGRFGRVEELDTALLFLASPASSFITGIVLPVDGGWTSR